MESPAKKPRLRRKSPTKSPTKKEKRLCKTKETEKTPPTLVKGKSDNVNMWTEPNLTKLIDYVKKNGFHGEYDEVRKLFPHYAISEYGLQRTFQQFSRWAEPIKDDPKDR